MVEADICVLAYISNGLPDDTYVMTIDALHIPQWKEAESLLQTHSSLMLLKPF